MTMMMTMMTMTMMTMMMMMMTMTIRTRTRMRLAAAAPAATAWTIETADDYVGLLVSSGRRGHRCSLGTHGRCGGHADPQIAPAAQAVASVAAPAPSRGIDYSKWDNIEDSIEEADLGVIIAQPHSECGVFPISVLCSLGLQVHLDDKGTTDRDEGSRRKSQEGKGTWVTPSKEALAFQENVQQWAGSRQRVCICMHTRRHTKRESRSRKFLTI